jgi:predicted nucleic acid-binding protein
LSSELTAAIRRIKPEKRIESLKRRDVSQLPFLGQISTPPPKLLYDTTVYIDILQDRFPRDGDLVLRAADAWHCTVAEAELVVLVGYLDPGHSDTAAAVKQITATVEKIPSHRRLAPDREAWVDAAVLAGVLARLQGYDKLNRKRVLNDALLFSIARKHGLSVLTRNIIDFDFLQQLEPTGRVLFYERV